MADDDDKKQGHTLSDHVLGQDFVHEHDGDADHDGREQVACDKAHAARIGTRRAFL